ncbi:spore germination protein GerKB [Clostridium sediminicola]|uniref:GerAB/ArcD/ProY family transporter n=1 Tax=Clostridium sediminicola TaxID=3114879 RepID=UPI0031F1CF2F
MNTEVISDKQGIVIIIMFLVGTAALDVRGIEAEQDFWISMILALILIMPIAIMYSRLCYILPNKDLFDILEICFGKFIGKIMVIFYTYYFLESGTMVLMNVSYFISLSSLDKTPLIVIKIIIMILCAWAVKLGIQLIGRWAEYMSLGFIAFIAISILLSIPNMDLNNLRPIFNNGINPIIKGTFATFVFPFGEIVTIYAAFSNFKSKKSPYKIYRLGFLGGIILLGISITNVLVLGINMASIYGYPTYSTMARIGISASIERIELIISIVYVLGAFIKVSVYLLAISKGIAKTFNFEDYKFLVIPTALFMLTLSLFLFVGVIDYWEYSDKIWESYAILFQVVFPIMIFIVAEVRKKRLKIP